MSINKKIKTWIYNHPNINSKLFHLARKIIQSRIFFQPLKVKPFFSVIVPIFNHYEHLEKCIQSVLNQTYPNYELILVDDFSPDKRVKVLLKKYSTHPKCIVLFNEKNMGISHTQNKAVLHAKHEWIAFLDCDDHLTSDALLWMAKAINVSPKSSYFFSDRATENEVENKTVIEYYGNGSNNYFRPISFAEKLFRMMFASHLKVINKSAYNEAGGSDPIIDGVQDWDTALKLVNKVHFFYVAKVIYFYRWHQNSQTLSNRFNLWRLDNMVRRRGLEIAFQNRDLNEIKELDQDMFIKISVEDLINVWKHSHQTLILSFKSDPNDELFLKFCVLNGFFDEVHVFTGSKCFEKIKHVYWNPEKCLLKLE